MITLDIYTEEKIPYYHCKRADTDVRPAVYVQVKRVSFGGRMLCSSCLNGCCSLTSPSVPCDLIAKTQTDARAWEILNQAHNRPKKED